MPSINLSNAWFGEAADTPPRLNAPWTREEFDFVVTAYKENIAFGAIAHIVGRTTGAIDSALIRKLGRCYESELQHQRPSPHYTQMTRHTERTEYAFKALVRAGSSESSGINRHLRNIGYLTERQSLSFTTEDSSLGFVPVDETIPRSAALGLGYAIHNTAIANQLRDAGLGNEHRGSWSATTENTFPASTLIPSALMQSGAIWNAEFEPPNQLVRPPEGARGSTAELFARVDEAVKLTQVSSLSGGALNWAVAKAIGLNPNFDIKEPTKHGFQEGFRDSNGTGHPLPFFDLDWSIAGPLLDAEDISFRKYHNPDSSTHGTYHAMVCKESGTMVSWHKTRWLKGATALEASMRCLVKTKLGAYLEIPPELL